MILDEANQILMRKNDDNPPSQVEILRAHAVLWRNSASPMMNEHAYYIDEAADRIEELEAEVNMLQESSQYPEA